MDFLLAGNVFSRDQIEAFSELKWEDLHRWEMTLSQVEFDIYYGY